MGGQHLGHLHREGACAINPRSFEVSGFDVRGIPIYGTGGDRLVCHLVLAKAHPHRTASHTQVVNCVRPYRLSRTPIYLALVLLTVASAVCHGSLDDLLCAFGPWSVLG